VMDEPVAVPVVVAVDVWVRRSAHPCDCSNT
jgi:hypothetical protein